MDRFGRQSVRPTSFLQVPRPLEISKSHLAILSNGRAKVCVSLVPGHPCTILSDPRGRPLTADLAQQVWETTLGHLQLQVTRPSYQTWLKDTVGLAYHDGQFVVGAPNTFVAEMLEQRMYSLISQAMERVTSDPVDVRFQVLQPADDSASNGIASAQSVASPAAEALPTVSTNGQHEFPQRPVAFNSRFTFETFIVGSSNELAHAAASAVADSPGHIYNPLVIYSDVGLGKTHLLHAVGQRIQAKGLPLIYATAEEFTNEYIKAIREGKTEEFRNRYRGAGALLLDDIQFLIGKEQTQEGFFHTFNALHLSNRQVVITSDRPVTALTLLEDRIQSRLAGGLVVDVQAPDFETRVAILRAKADLMGQHLDNKVLEMLSQSAHSNIRELEGCLTRVLAYAQLARSTVTIALVEKAMAEILSRRAKRRLQPEALLDAVAHYFNVEKPILSGPRGKKHVAQARHVAMYLLKEETHLGFSAIGRLLGGRDHSTVLHGCARVSGKLDSDPGLRRDVMNIRQTLASS